MDNEHLKSDRKHKILSWASIIILAFAVLLIYVWIFDKKYPVEVNSAVVKETSSEQLLIDWDIKKNRQCSGDVTRQIIDKNKVVWDLYSDNENTYLDVGRHRFVKAYNLPSGIPSGNATFRSVIVWTCNPLSRLRQEVVHIDFRIPRTYNKN